MDRDEYTNGEKSSPRAMTPTDNQELASCIVSTIALCDPAGVKDEPHDIDQNLSYDEDECEHSTLSTFPIHTR